jgi:phosphate transport system substrate-binding protein
MIAAARRFPRKLCQTALFVSAVCLSWPAMAEQVTLTSRSGDLSISGEILGFDGLLVRLDTAWGEVSVHLDDVVCTGARCPSPETLIPEVRFSGDEEIAQIVLPALIETYATEKGLAFERISEGPAQAVYELRSSEDDLVARFGLRSTTTADGVIDLVAGEADIAMTTRTLTAEELGLARDAGLGRLDQLGRVRTLALTGVIPVTGQGQRVNQISLTDLARVYSGEVTNWQDLGGDDIPLSAHLGPKASGQVEGFVDRLLTRTDRELVEVIHHDSDAALAQAVAADPGAIGILPFDAIGETQPLSLIGNCGLRADANPRTIRSEDYPLTLPLLLYQPMRRLPDAGGLFLAWLNTSEAQLVLRRAGVVGPAPQPIPWAEQGERLAAAIRAAGPEVPLVELQRMIEVLGPLVRLTPTFRFEDGSTRLDAVSRSNLVLIAQMIRDGRYTGQTLVLAGFSDGRGPSEANRELSAARADVVRREIIKSLGGQIPNGVTLETAAFGEALPLGCDDTIWGQEANRRVELWVSTG